MLLDETRILDFLNARTTRQKACELCGHKEWSYNQKVFELREFSGGNLVVGNTSIVPLFSISCDNCGNTKLFNAIAAGLVDKQGNPVR